MTSIAPLVLRAEPLRAEDRPLLAKLLDAEGLPSDDLGESDVVRMISHIRHMSGRETCHRRRLESKDQAYFDCGA